VATASRRPAECGPFYGISIGLPLKMLNYVLCGRVYKFNSTLANSWRPVKILLHICRREKLPHMKNI